MAELDFDQFDSGRSGTRSAQMTGIFNIAGGVCSIALVVGLGVWGYKLAVRDVNGVPVIRAMAGPMRVMPQAPGGDVASFQGLSVNAVAAVGTAASMPDQVLLAPAPVELASEDAPGLGVHDPSPVAGGATIAADLGMDVGSAPIDPTALEPLPQDTLPVTVTSPPAGADIGTGSATDEAIARALADALADGAVPFTDLAPDVAADLTEDALAPQSSPRPRARPVAGVESPVIADPATPAASAVGPTEIDPSSLSVGTRLVQLGAFDDDAGARAEWARLQGEFGDVMAGKALVIQAAQSGGRTFYRLRAHGFAGEDDARQFCSALVARNTPCIPALHR